MCPALSPVRRNEDAAIGPGDKNRVNRSQASYPPVVRAVRLDPLGHPPLDSCRDQEGGEKQSGFHGVPPEIEESRGKSAVHKRSHWTATIGKNPWVAEGKRWNGGTGLGSKKRRPVGGPFGLESRMGGGIEASGQMYQSGFP